MGEILSFQQRLDEEHRQALALIPEGLADFSSIDRARERADGLMKAAAARQAPVRNVAIEDRTVPGEGDRPDLPIRLYRPDELSGSTPAMLFIHGGGFVVGSVSHFDVQCMQLARGAGIIVTSIEYRLAPESPYPEPLDDCYAALAWMHGSADELAFDRGRIGVGGTSAGSGLAAGLALLARDRGDYPIAFQFLEAPMLDHRTTTPSSQAIDDGRVWNTKSNRLAWSAYLGSDHLDRDIPAYASPTLAGDLAGLPPAYISVGGQDLFADEAIDYAQRLRRAGVPVQFHLYEVGFHGSPRVLPQAAASVRWRRDAIEALARLAAAQINPTTIT